MKFKHKTTDLVKVRLKRWGSIYIPQYRYYPLTFKEWLFGKWINIGDYIKRDDVTKEQLKQILEKLREYKTFAELNKYVIKPANKERVKSVVNSLIFNDHIRKSKK
jgi:hypothetical protein